MDEKQNENSPKAGDTYMSLDTSLKDIYWVVESVQIFDTGTMVALKGLLKPEYKISWPLLFIDQKFVKVNETTVRILFGNKGAKNGTTNNDQKG